MNRYDNFFLPAQDLAASRTFYHDVLGMTLKFDLVAQGIIAFNVGEEEPAIFLGNRWRKPAIWFAVDDVRETYAILQQRGVTFLAEPFAIQTGLAAEFEDPDGNRLGITDYSKLPALARTKHEDSR